MHDILFVVDNSCNAQGTQVGLGEGIASFLGEFLKEPTLDWHIGVTSTDMDGIFGPNGTEGALRQIAGYSWLDPSTPNPTQVFVAMAAMGTSGSTSERGLHAAFTALEDPKTNLGFRRPDGNLAVIVVSSEPNRGQIGEIDLDDYVYWFENEAVPPALATTYAIADLKAGVDYVQAAEQTGGFAAEIDDADWPPLMASVAIDIIDNDEIPRLPGPIDPKTLEAWHIPRGAEPTRIDDAAVTYVDKGPLVVVNLGKVLPRDEVYLLYELL